MKPRLVVVGPTPPPFYGVAVATKIILESRLSQEFELLYLDTSDRRQSLNFGIVDFTNVYLACKHILKLISILITRRPSVVYIPISQGWAGYLRDAVFIFVSALARARVVLHLRGAYFRIFYGQTTWLMRWIIRRSLTCGDRMIVLGNSVRNLFDGLVDSSKIRVVPNGVNPEDFPSEDRELRGSKTVRLCYLSQLYREKGYFDVLQALVGMNSKAEVECHFAGKWKTDEERRVAEDFVAKNGLDAMVKFVGVVHGLGKLEFLASADIFVFPSYYPAEGHPWAILEAMASGLPIISTDHACIPETVVDGESGFIVEKRDVNALRDRIETLVNDPRLRIQMGIEARKRIQESFTRDLFIKRLAAVFSEVMEPELKLT